MPQLPGRHLQQSDLATMGVEQHQTTPSHGSQLFPQLHYHSNQQVGGETEGAGKGSMLRREADDLGRQAPDRQLRIEIGNDSPVIRSANRASVTKGMGAMLFTGTEARSGWIPPRWPTSESLARRAARSGADGQSSKLPFDGSQASPSLSEWPIDHLWFMAAAGSSQPNRRKAPRAAATPPLQVMKINRKEEQEQLQREAAEARAAAEAAAEKARLLEEKAGLVGPPRSTSNEADEDRFDMGAMEGMTMADLMGAPEQAPRRRNESKPRSVDDFDFDEEAFLAALDENAPIGTTGDGVEGTVIGLESDGIYVDIGGKAPGFMPKSEAGLGVITNLSERFPKGLRVQVLVTREQNADGMVTISCRALELRKSWDKVKEFEKEGKVVQVVVNGFNRGGVTCDLEGLRGFIPRSLLEDGENHQELVGKTLGVAFIEVNSKPASWCSQKRAAVAARFQELEVGQLVEGVVAAVKLRTVHRSGESAVCCISPLSPTAVFARSGKCLIRGSVFRRCRS